MFNSIQQILKEAVRAFLRFPFAILFGVLVAFFLSWEVNIPYGKQKELQSLLFDLAMAGYLGMLGGVFFPLLGKSGIVTRKLLPLFHICSAFLFLGFFLYFPDVPRKVYPNSLYFIFFLLTLALHFGVAFAPFVKNGDLKRFWQYNKDLFLRIFLAALYTGVLYIGLTVAMLAFDNLFGFRIDNETYLILWFFLTGVFNTWFFVAGIPEEPLQIDPEFPYPKGLKRFTQYVLLPLVTVYLVILYLYIIKVLVLWELPEGWTAYLVLSFSIVGILALLLLYPIQDEVQNKWVRIYSKGFHLALFPLIVLLGVAIFMRLHQYGITENRYFVVVLAAWLTGIAIHFSIAKKGNIKAIPVSLFLICLLASFGPWSAFNLAQMDQQDRMRTELKKAGALNEKGLATEFADTVSRERVDEIRDLVNYLEENHGPEGLQPLFSTDLDSLFKADSIHNHYQRRGRVMELLGAKAVHGRLSPYNNGVFKNGYVKVEDPVDGVDLAQFDRMFHLRTSRNFPVEDIEETFNWQGERDLKISVQREDPPHLKIIHQDTLLFQLDLKPRMKEWIEDRDQGYFSLTLSLEDMTFEKMDGRGRTWNILIQSTRFDHGYREEEIRIRELEVLVFVGGME